MTVILICAFSVSALFGFVMYAMCAIAADADRREEELFTEWQKKHEDGDS